MRRLSPETRDRDAVEVTKRVIDIDGSVDVDIDDPTTIQVVLGGNLAFHIETPTDLYRIKDIALSALALDRVEDGREDWFIQSLLALDTSAEFEPVNGRAEWEQAIARLAGRTSDQFTSIEAIFIACLAIEQRWTEPGVDPDWLGVVAIFWPLRRAYNHTILVRSFNAYYKPQYETPALVIHEGSLTASLAFLKAGYSATKWMFVFYGSTRPRFTSAHEAATWFVDNVRKRALSAVPPPIQFDRLDDPKTLSRYPLEKHDAYFIYLHGLFSTDLGTFDGFVDSWGRVRSNLRLRYGSSADTTFNRICHVGWPHDSLAPIDENAEDLARLIVSLFDSSDANIVLICHSRGGLVARRALQYLVFRNVAWASRIACVATFGTPHNGAELAQYPGRYEGAYLLLLDGTQQFVALDFLFVYLQHTKAIRGIDDLAPTGNQVSRFLEKLQQLESTNDTGLIITVGGDVSSGWTASTFFRRIFNRAVMRSVDQLLGTRNHDIVVTQASSFGAKASSTFPFSCSHFSYFEHPQNDSLDAVTLKIADILGIEKRVEACAGL